MTTAEHLRSMTAARAAQVMIAGVAWPLYKVVALVVALAVFLVVGAVTTTAAAAVLAAAASGVAIWSIAAVSRRRRQ